MTVEQSHLEFFRNRSPEAQIVLNQLKEITGVSDFAILEQALEASKNACGKYDIHHAINILVDENSQSSEAPQMLDPQPFPNVPSPTRVHVPVNNTTGVIDLTSDSNEKEDDLEKAIALSLKEQQRPTIAGELSMEDQDISRVVEASLAESKAGTKRKRGEAWLDPLNPHDRKRNGDWPVGLKNVGNTCWFSAVIQSLFHLPIFRRLVLSFPPDSCWNNVLRETKEKRNLVFMQELRKLFALMLCSKRKYVDPSHALEELKEAFPDSGSTDSQQDVSEFSHKLLEWLEDAFKLNACSLPNSKNSMAMDDSSDPKSNPMLDLFYGHFRSEGHNEGHRFSNEEAFGQYPLQVNGFSDIHESLDSAMAQEIESCNDGMSKSGQESWFTRLPPVLLFELSRFQFNQQMGRPEKIHNKLEFPEVIFMDRYRIDNKDITRAKREKVRVLKDQREKFQSRLEKYLNYGSGAKRVPLPDVLQYTLEFVESKKAESSPTPIPCTDDVEMASPVSASSFGNDSPHSSYKSAELSAVPVSYMCSSSSQTTYTSSAGDCEMQVEEVTVPSEAKPSPQHVSDVELRVLQSCLRRWRTEVESDVKELQDSINEIDNEIKEIYCEDELQQEPYRLHAVLVHEGQAASGHYWAYVYSPGRDIWLKFNDITVTDATWAELQKESMGGHHYASAYCLVYVDQHRDDLFEETKESEMTSPSCLDGLPEDLQKYVEQDNNLFLQELEQWDLEQSRKKDSSTMTVSYANDGDCTIVAEKRMVVEESPMPLCNSLSMQHAKFVVKNTLSKIDHFLKIANTHGAEVAMDETLKLETSRLRRIARLRMSSHEDPRLQHIGVYILLNADSADPYLSWSILEQFTIPDLEDAKSGSLLRKTAAATLKKLVSNLDNKYHETYAHWHKEYEKFRQLVTFFVQGITLYFNASYSEALVYLIECCNSNDNLISTPPGKNKGLNPKLLAYYRRECILRLNEELAGRFVEDDLAGAMKALTHAYHHILPCMEFLAAPDAMECDKNAATQIRNRWFSIVGLEVGSKKMERLQDYLTNLLETPSSSSSKHRQPPPLRIINLNEKLQSFMASITSSPEYKLIESTT